MSYLELIYILSPLSSSARQTEEAEYIIETEKKYVLFVHGNKDIEFVFQPCGDLASDVCSELGICICKNPFE